MLGAATHALASHWRRHPGQLLTLLLGLALATALWSAVQAINAEARASYERAAGTLGLQSYDALAVPGGMLTRQDFVDLRRSGWRVSPVLEGRYLPGDVGPPLTVVGIDPLSAPPGVVPAGVAEAGPEIADLLGQTAAIFAAPAVAARLDEVTDLPEIRASAAVPPGQLLTDLSVAERLLGTEGELSRLILLPDQPFGRPPLAEIAPGLVREAGTPEGEIARLTRSFHLNLTAFGLLSFGVGLFIVHGSIGLAFEQRRGTIRTLRALGMPARRVGALLLAEVVVLALLAGLLGVGLGYAIAAVLLPDVAATLRGLYGAAVPGVLSFDPIWALAGLGMALAGAVVAAAQGIMRVMAMPLLASARPRAWRTVSEAALQRQVWAGLALVALGVLAPLLGDGLLAGFALLAGLLLGAALMLPWVLSVVLAFGARKAHGALAQWFWADTRQQLPGLSLALMALLLALAANIGVGTMVGSFRLTFTGWLDQRLAADLYVSVADAEQASALERFAAAEGADLLPRVSVPATLGGRPGTLEGIIDHPIYRETWPILTRSEGAWDAVRDTRGALVNEQLALRSGLRPGDPLVLAPGWEVPVVGIYSDYGNPAGQVFVALDAMRTRFPEADPRSFGLLTDDPAGLRARLGGETGIPDGAVIDQAAVKAISLNVFERTFAVTGALNVLTLGVAGIAILTALATLASMRLPQLAPVWALGLTRARLAWLDLLRSVLLAVLTFLLAVPVGLAVAWALLAVVNVEAFGWRLPMHVFPASWAVLLALSVVAAAAASAAPALRLARGVPADFLKVFANER